eukprot:CAMPEP_0194751202 /NCGR_PEP_ID=MMETSP0323_2-20130528/5301_1 /TAXON_ID=2866 ORGANISM="Crypthecodinium cohnii, Strain Seligo" /NCGR_SAMPLE_ID=MMETSP0323_2 /ASSEMBLY_ACC=CAM_ASM_000346 /LENGTH=40 /DNA_ID= /DNA_START= /DNA_END= /DNA_ORIENTATION=
MKDMKSSRVWAEYSSGMEVCLHPGRLDVGVVHEAGRVLGG